MVKLYDRSFAPAALLLPSPLKMVPGSMARKLSRGSSSNKPAGLIAGPDDRALIGLQTAIQADLVRGTAGGQAMQAEGRAGIASVNGK
jgi:hypothetical protein